VRRFWTLTAFAVAMAYIESAVVVYLRQSFYPDGFRFPAVAIPMTIYAIEVGRELGTLVMLYCAARLSGRDRWERFLHFCFLFGVWDIFYYVWLKLFLGWPESLLTWDILFLVPLPWVGPVLAPLLVSAALIGGSVHLSRLRRRGREPRFSRLAWSGAVGGGLLVLWSFLWEFEVVTRGGLPGRFPWWLFLIGYLGGLAVFIVSVRRLAPATHAVRKEDPGS
jgi:hypothetical protein